MSQKMESFKLQLLAALDKMVLLQSEIQNQQLLRDFGSMIYRMFPTEDVLNTVESSYKSLPNKIDGGVLTSSTTSGYRVYQSGMTVEKKTVIKSLKLSKAVVEADEDGNDTDLDIENESEPADLELYMKLTEMGEDEVIKYFGTLTALKQFAKTVGVEIAMNAKQTIAVAVLQEHLITLI